MTVSTIKADDAFVGNGTTKTFPCAFKVFDATHLQVYVDGVLQILTTDYTVSSVGGDVTDVVLVTAPGEGAKVSVFRKVPLTQETDYQANDPFPAETHERVLDLLTMGLQQLGVEVGRAVHAAPNDPAELSMVLPQVADRAGKLLTFGSDGKPLVTETVDVEGLALAALPTAGAMGDGDFVMVSQSGVHKKVTRQNFIGLGPQTGANANITYNRATHGDFTTFYYNANTGMTADRTLTFPAAEGVRGGLAIVRVKEDAGHNILVRIENPDALGTYEEVEVPANYTRILRKDQTGRWWTDMGYFPNNGSKIAVKGEAVQVIKTHEDEAPRLRLSRNEGGLNEQVWHAWRIDENGSLVCKDETADADRISLQTNGHVNFQGNPITASLRVVEGRSGTLDFNASNRRITTNGSLTLPALVGWWAWIRLGAATHDITVTGMGTIDSSAQGWGAGDLLLVTITGAATFEIVRFAAAGIVDEGDVV
jgi:hypothetical protein